MMGEKGGYPFFPIFEVISWGALAASCEGASYKAQLSARNLQRTLCHPKVRGRNQLKLSGILVAR